MKTEAKKTGCHWPQQKLFAEIRLVALWVFVVHVVTISHTIGQSVMVRLNLPTMVEAGMPAPLKLETVYDPEAGGPVMQGEARFWVKGSENKNVNMRINPESDVLACAHGAGLPFQLSAMLTLHPGEASGFAKLYTPKRGSNLAFTLSNTKRLKNTMPNPPPYLQAEWRVMVQSFVSHDSNILPCTGIVHVSITYN